MKKKASLWISGITTVAMLAVAVGSFAAWDTLTEKTDTFTATTGDPAVLNVTSTALNPDGKLVPSDAIISTTAKDATSLNIGTVKAEVKTVNADESKQIDKSDGTTISCTLTGLTINSEDKSSGLKVTLVPGNGATNTNDISLTKDTAAAIEPNIEYTAKLEFSGQVNESDVASFTAKDVSVNLKVDAAKKNN